MSLGCFKQFLFLPEQEDVKSALCQLCQGEGCMDAYMWIIDKVPVDGSQDMRPMACVGLRQLGY